MTLTRRQFTLASTSLVALTVLGCDNSSPPPRKKSKSPLPASPFNVGSPAGFTAAGLYGQFNSDKRVWLVSDGKKLVALADVCTHSGCGLSLAGDELKCPCHGSVFDLQGVPAPGSRAKKPLDRFAITLVETAQGPRVRIDPAKRFKQADWSDPQASLTLT